MNASIVCIKTTNKALLLLTKCQPRNSCSPDSNDRIKERPVSGHYTHLSTHTHTHTATLCNTQTTVPKTFRSRLTMATHPRAGALSLTAERWLKNGELRFASRNVCTCCMALDIGCRIVFKTALRGRRRHPVSVTYGRL